MGCASSKQFGRSASSAHEDPAVLASQTSFTVNEVEALYELYKKLSFSIVKDGLIHKEEFQFALFRNSKRANLFADRVSVSFPFSHLQEETELVFTVVVAFKLYDLRGTGYIEKEELREMVLALLDESDLCLSDSTVETIVDNTFSQADSNGDGRIDPEEWEEFVKKNPATLRNMSLPYLQ
uniref:Calcineurin B-like protein n=1 Tax=Sorghum bicolor TaxID=4558 RepID=C4P7Y7_SORBI|nr:calcineurin B-like protein 08 [Sorghum bicolor]